MQAAIERHAGQVFKTVGDAFCGVFSRAPDAVAAALDAERSIAAQDFSTVGGLRVRIALHTGHAEERNGDYFGPAVNRVARLLSIGHGGQVLASGVTTELAQDEMPAQSSLRDLGLQRLRDLTYPEQVYQLCAPDLPSEFPPLRSLDELPNNLPLQVTSFVGREREAETLKERLAKARLLTLVGAGGIGKTRLSLQLGADVLDDFEDGVWFVELAAVRDAQSLPDVVASTFNVSPGEGRTSTDAVVNYLKRKKALVIFDNCEHLVEAAAHTIDAIIRGCPQIKVIASSRQGLDIAGETVHRVTSLTIPETGQSVKAEHALEYGSIALFVDRAQAASDGFALTNENVEHVARICRRLDGIALAIELAASRVKVMNVASLADRLNERFRILTGGSRTALPRQQTMRALIDWSYDLLAEKERALFERVSVFAGGWTLEAASSIATDDLIEDWEVLDILSALVDKSLVAVDLSGREERYRLLESTRQYALEKLEALGEFDRLAFRHAEYFARVCVETDLASAKRALSALAAVVEPEIDNVRAALVWTITERHDVTTGCRIVGALGHFWRDLSAGEGERWIRSATEAATDEVPPEIHARLLLAFGEVDPTADPRVLDAASRAREMYAQLGMRREVALATRMVGFYHIRRDENAEALPLLNEALAEFRALGDERWIGRTQSDIATALWLTGNVQEARALYAQAMSAARSFGDNRELTRATLNLAESEFANSEPEAALARAMEASTNEGVNSRAIRANVLSNIAAYQLSLGRFDEARTNARASLLVARELQSSSYTFISLQHLAGFAARRGDKRRSARLLGWVNGSYDALKAQREWTEARTYEQTIEVLHGLASPEELAMWMADGATMTEEQAIEEGLAI
jgi:predicted ATPase